jgi:hypothetical protein
MYEGGSRGDVLTTDGNGTVSWTQPGTVCACNNTNTIVVTAPPPPVVGTTVPNSTTVTVVATADYTLNGQLGACLGLTVMAGGLLDVGTGVTSSGSVGTLKNPPAVSIIYTSGGQNEFNTPLSINCSSDYKTVATLATQRPCTKRLALDLYQGTGQTLLAGVYCPLGDGAFTMSAGTLTFHGNATDEFILTTPGAMGTAANTFMVLTGGALAKNVIWRIAGALTVGAHTAVAEGDPPPVTAFVGTALVAGAITISASARVVGHLFGDAAITLSERCSISTS